MPLVRVSENLSKTLDAITNFEMEIEDLNKRVREIKDEILRLEGCKLLLETYEQAGIEDIVPQDEQFEYFKVITKDFTLKKDPRPLLGRRRTREIYERGDEVLDTNGKFVRVDDPPHNEDPQHDRGPPPDQENHTHHDQESQQGHHCHQHDTVNGERPKDMIRHLINHM